jgi:hypothetical protein
MALGFTKLSQDDVELTDAENSGFTFAPTLTQLGLGYEVDLTAGANVELWMDEVVIDYFPIGCGN